MNNKSPSSRVAESPTELLLKNSRKFYDVKTTKTERDAIKKDVRENIEQVLKNNLQSGSYVLEQDGKMVTETALKDQGNITLNQQVKNQKGQKSLSRNVGERVSVTEANTNKTTEQSSKG